MSRTPIADHAMLSDRHTAALVDTDGSVVWLCLPRFDSPSVFGRLLDPDAGHWSIGPVGACTASRRYLDDSLVLQSTFETTTGVLVVTDLLCLGPDNGGHRLGTDVPHTMIRRAACTKGSIDVRVVYRPRPEYASRPSRLAPLNDGVRTPLRTGQLVLSSPVPLQITGDTATGRAVLHSGDDLVFGMQYVEHPGLAARRWPQAELAKGLEDTVGAWRSWGLLHQSYDGPWAELVRHSGRVLHGLSFQPTGATVAAATTSLPEEVGGRRNWDYRYSWVRDASMTMEALWVAACPDEAVDFFTFLSTAAAGSAGDDFELNVMFGVDGERELVESELPHLQGWRGSQPVRIGNGAWDQRQLDIYGELLAAAYRLRHHLERMSPTVKGFLVGCADAAARRWTERDHGVWEVRGPKRHFLHSKVMCWVALDRAIAMGDLLGAPEAAVAGWTRARSRLRHRVLTDGWSDELGAFAATLGGREPDAAALIMSIVGIIEPDDPRMLATLDVVERDLTDSRGLVYRYRTASGVDGLSGGEGTFLLCTFWLAQGLALAGQVDRAVEVFSRAAAHVNDVGLLAEEVDPSNGELLGNFPQAFSHVGLVNAAWTIHHSLGTTVGPLERDGHRQPFSHDALPR